MLGSDFNCQLGVYSQFLLDVWYGMLSCDVDQELGNQSQMCIECCVVLSALTTWGLKSIFVRYLWYARL